MLILLTTIFFQNSTLNSAVVDITMCRTSLEGCSLEVTSLKGCSQSFRGGRAQSVPLTALIGYLNVLLEYFDFSNFHWQGGFLKPLETPSARPCCSLYNFFSSLYLCKTHVYDSSCWCYRTDRLMYMQCIPYRSR